MLKLAKRMGYSTASVYAEILGELEDKGLLRMVHYGSLSWHAINRVSRRVV